MPTLGLRGKSVFVLIFIFYPETSNVERPTSNAKLSAFGVECWALSVRCFFLLGLSVDRHVLVVLLQFLSVLGDLNGFRIEDPNRYVLTAKFNWTISWRDPSFECGFSVVAERYPHVSSLERLDGDSILFG